jgi:hypothetical protein
VDCQQSVKYKSTRIKTLWPVHTETSSKDRQIEAYSIGLTSEGKLSCPNNKKTMFLILFSLFLLFISVSMAMGLYHPPDDITNLKYKMLYFLTPIKKSKRKALAFNLDRCCHLFTINSLSLDYILPLMSAFSQCF